MTARESDPAGRPSARIGRGAVLYDTRPPGDRPCCTRGGRCLAHVTGVYEETTTGTVIFEVQDGTHTTRERIHADDLLALFQPAGWAVDVGIKPTYILTRQHDVSDHHDRLTYEPDCERCRDRGYIWIDGVTDAPCPDCTDAPEPRTGGNA